ncbi:homeobox protein HAT3.1 isoform X2 [Prosopis cineraria]|nr:homeobox protein HAT3.1 isoform X2 [Prosopis cineraria]XP_054777294.1 homeobox protein HAT3.1 isoform X2 [Prosopis cineraria]
MDASSEKMSGEMRKLICHNQNTSESLHTSDPGTYHFGSSGKNNETDSEFLDKKLSTEEANSSVDEKSPKVSDGMAENLAIQLPAEPHCDLGNSCQNGEGTCFQHNTLEQANAIGMEVPSYQMSSETRELRCHNNNTSDQLHTLDLGNTLSELSEKTNQIGSESLDNEQRVLGTRQTTSLLHEKSPSDGMTGTSVIQVPVQPQCDLDKSCQTEEGSSFQLNTLELGKIIGMDASSDHLSSKTARSTCHIHNTSEKLQTFDPRTAHFEMSEKTNQTGSEFLNNEQKVLGTGETSSLLDGKQLKVSDSMTGDSVIQLPAESQCDLDNVSQNGGGSCFQYDTLKQVSGSLSNDEFQNKHQQASQSVHNEPVERSGGNEQLDPPSQDTAKVSSPNFLQRNSRRATHARVGRKDKRTATSLKKKYMLRSSDRVLRSRMREKPKPPTSNTNLVNVDHVGENRRKGKKKKKKGRGRRVTDEFSRIRARLRYFLSQVRYKQSLIDAYSGEGWKGYSLEKLKPEKELQCAKSKILGFKLKIRDLFRHLDTLCAEGRLPQSLFDSKGEICSEDIFCAKCMSKDLTTGNDIILCDGVCDRGFHQFCLEPPLLSENIPPDDEGWLCPGCDCKDDCFDLLNDLLGTSLSIYDSWERVFPEAAAVAGNKVDGNLGLPSDDSDDDDYNPDVTADEEVEGGKSSSDESENASASEKMEAPHSGNPYLGLPSDDSEDNDYDPSAVDHDKDAAEESSGSDFTSDSEDLADVVKGNTISGQDNHPVPASSLQELDPGEEDSTPVSGKRHIERLDYKKLYDETYQNASSDTSDDEDWTASPALSRKKKVTSEGLAVSPNGKASILDHIQKGTESTPRRNNRQTEVESMDNSPNKSLAGSKRAGSNGKKRGSSTYRRLGEDAVKVLYKNFRENQYPDRTTKESMAQELGLTFNQVRKWFENARWSFRNSPRMEARASESASQGATSSRVENEIVLGDEKRNSKSGSQEGNIQKSKSQSSRKRKHKTVTVESDANTNIDSAATNPLVHSSRVGEVQRSRKMKTRKGK